MKAFFTTLFILPLALAAQNRPSNDSAQGNAPKVTTGVKPYNEVVPGRAKTDVGLFKVHKVDENILFEIPDSLLGLDILVVNRISRSAAGSRVSMMGYAGAQIGENVVRFEKGPNNKIFLKSISFQEMSKDSSENGLYRSVLNSNVQPVVASFDIRALFRDSLKGTSGSVIDERKENALKSKPIS